MRMPHIDDDDPTEPTYMTTIPYYPCIGKKSALKLDSADLNVD